MPIVDSKPSYTEQDIQLAEMYLQDGVEISEVEDLFMGCSKDWYDIVWTACHRMFAKTGDRKYRRR